MNVEEVQSPQSTTVESKPVELSSASSVSGNSKLKTGLATAAVVGVGAALIEVEWIPGLLLGVAAMVAPGLVPKVGRGVRPFVHSAIKNGYAATRKTREWMAEAGEQVSDMVAEVRASATEHETPAQGVPMTVASPSVVSKASTKPVIEPIPETGMQAGA